MTKLTSKKLRIQSAVEMTGTGSSGSLRTFRASFAALSLASFAVMMGRNGRPDEWERGGDGRFYMEVGANL